MYNARSHKSTIHTRQDAVCCMLLPLDSRHYHRGGGQQRDQVGQGRAAAVVSDEDGRLSQCQRAQLHHELARWPGLQCTHSQTQVRRVHVYALQILNRQSICMSVAAPGRVPVLFLYES